MDKSVYSAGARYARAAMRRYLQRLLKAMPSSEVDHILKWVQTREKRYDKKPGGL